MIVAVRMFYFFTSCRSVIGRHWLVRIVINDARCTQVGACSLSPHAKGYADFLVIYGD